jgi:hypothetical protein
MNKMLLESNYSILRKLKHAVLETKARLFELVEKDIFLKEGINNIVINNLKARAKLISSLVLLLSYSFMILINEIEYI